MLVSSGIYFVHNSLVSMYGKFRLLDVARHLSDKMATSDSVSWNTMIPRACGRTHLSCLKTCRWRALELILLWNTIVGGCLRTGNFKGALELLSQTRICDILLDSVALTIGLSACSHIGVIKLGKAIPGFAIRSCCDGYDNVNNALITLCSKCKDLRKAYTLFELIEERSIITWNSMLSGYSRMDRAEEALFLYMEMLYSGIEPNYVTIASIFPLYAQVANLQHGNEFYCYITMHALFDDCLLSWNALVDMYARSGKVLQAKRVFDSMSKRDEVTYTSMIAGYGVQGARKAALKLFEDMNLSHIKSDHVTMVSFLSACSHYGIVIQGQMMFEKMLNVHGILDLEHYACMVDLFGRVGILNKAKEIIARMPYKPASAMWATLIEACRFHGNVEIWEWVAMKLLEMRPGNSGYYVSSDYNVLED